MQKTRPEAHLRPLLVETSDLRLQLWRGFLKRYRQVTPPSGASTEDSLMIALVVILRP
jgi:hypothetical protein